MDTDERREIKNAEHDVRRCQTNNNEDSPGVMHRTDRTTVALPPLPTSESCLVTLRMDTPD